MKLHLVGGFLGSGKTTAIIQAAKAWMAQGKSVGVITNDQGKFLVDTAFFRLADVPAVEVTGGCFCCNYNDLDSQLAQLIEDRHPNVIFAESVGSCADIVATVIRPLLQLSQSVASPASFSVFTDARLFRRRLLDLEMPFSDDVVYIFGKQIEEAGLLVVNKIDLLSPTELAQIQECVKSRYPQKTVLYQSALTANGIDAWLEYIQTEKLTIPERPLEIDYHRYGNGEQQLSWLDETVRLERLPGQGRETLRNLIETFRESISQQGAAVGHIKFIIESGSISAKISLPTLSEPDWDQALPEVSSSSLNLLVNARVEMKPEVLKALFAQALEASGMRYMIDNEDAFQPGQPDPFHRIT